MIPQTYMRLKGCVCRPFVILLLVLFGLVYFNSFWVPLFGNKDSLQFRGDIPLRQLMVAAIDAAERGGEQVRIVREGKHLQESSKGKTAEGVNDPVTLGDHLSHREMFHSLKRRFPTLNIVSEEKEQADGEVISSIRPAKVESEVVSRLISSTVNEFVAQDDILVWIDPLDATKEYTEKLTQYVTTMVCVAIKGVPIIGIIHNPFTKATVWAWRGVATSQVLNSERHSETGEMRFIVSRSHAGSVNSSLQNSFGNKIKVIAAGGAGFKSLALINRHADVYMHSTKIKKWDVCSGAAIIESFGGRVSDLKGAQIDFGNSKDYVMKDGLLATMKDHVFFLEKLRQ